MIRYEHTQRATAIVIVAIVGMAVGLGVLALQGHIAGMVLLIVVPVIMFALFGSLTVRIDNDALTVLFGIGLIRHRVALRDIASCQQVRTHWYEGWGIRLTTRGWLFNISGFDAIMITRTNGRRFLVGTDEPQRFHAALSQAIAGKIHD